MTALDLHVEDGGDGAVLKVWASPGSRRERIVGVRGDALKVAVSPPPEKGRANDRLVLVLAKELGLPTRIITLASGETSRDKRLRFAGVSAARLRELLDALLSR